MYYYRKEGREIGPVGADKIVTLFEDGQISATDLVRVDGTATWLSAAQVVPSLSGPSRLPRVGRTHVYGSPSPAVGVANPTRGTAETTLEPVTHVEHGTPAAAPVEPPLHRGPSTLRVESKPPAHAPMMFDATVKDQRSPFSEPQPADPGRTEAIVGLPKSRTVPSADYLKATGATAPEPAPPAPRPAPAPKATEPVGSPPAAAQLDAPAPAVSPAFRAERRNAGARATALVDGMAGAALGARPARHEPRARERPPIAGPVRRPLPRDSAYEQRAERLGSGPGESPMWRYLRDVTGGRPWVLLVALAVIASFAVYGVYDHFTAGLHGQLPLAGTKTKTKTELTLGPGRAVIKTGSHTATGTARVRRVQMTERLVETPDRLRRHYVEDVRERTLSLRGAPELQQRTEGPLAGQVVLFEREGDGWKRSLRGEASPTAEQELTLQSLEADPRGLYPDGRLWTGHSWPLDARVLCATLGVLEECEGEAFMIFQRFVTFRGERCAHLTYSIEMTTEYEGMKLQMTLTGDIFRSIARGLDVQNEAEGTFTLSGDGGSASPGQTLVELSGPVELLQTSSRTGKT